MLLKLKNVCLFVLGYGLLLILLNMRAVLGASSGAYTLLFALSLQLPQFVIGALVYIPFFWKRYKLKTLLPLFLTLFICILLPVSSLALGHIRRISLRSRLDSYAFAVKTIQERYVREISTGADFIIPNDDYSHLGEKIMVSPKMFNSFAVAFKQKNDWPESTILFVNNDETLNWSKVSPVLGTHKKITPHWYCMYKSKPPDLSKHASSLWRPSIRIKQPYCPYRRN